MTKSIVFVGLLLVLSLAVPAVAQPFASYLTTPAASNGYVVVPHNAAFNSTNAFTFEAWVSVKDSGSCTTIYGKNYLTGQWVGVCGTTLRSYLHGSGSLFDGGVVPVSDWTHIAVTFDGTTHRHYIDGEEVASRAEPGDLNNNTSELRIGSDVSWQFSPNGSIDEVRFWNVARTKAEIRSTITRAISSGPGLIAVYHLDGNGSDAVAGLNGTIGGTQSSFQSPSPSTCVSNTTTLCFESGRFAVSSKWMTPGGETGAGTVVPGASQNAGLFWFFAPDNWELLVKELNGCGVNARRWVFSAATTNVHYRLSVTEGTTGSTKRYFNYQGDNAPAVNDTGAFGTCP
jgi:hypothetical protein